MNSASHSSIYLEPDPSLRIDEVNKFRLTNVVDKRCV